MSNRNDPDKQRLIQISTLLEESNTLLEQYEDEPIKEKYESIERQIRIKLKKIQPLFTQFKIRPIELKPLETKFDKFLKNLEDVVYEKQNPISPLKKETSMNVVEYEFDETEIKMEELNDLRKIQRAYSAIGHIQDMVNIQLSEDTQNLDDVIMSSEEAISKTQTGNNHLIEAAKYKANTRAWKFQAGATVVGGIVGSWFGAIGGLFVSRSVAKAVEKKHNKKLDAIAKDMKESNAK